MLNKLFKKNKKKDCKIFVINSLIKVMTMSKELMMLSPQRAVFKNSSKMLLKKKTLINRSKRKKKRKNFQPFKPLKKLQNLSKKFSQSKNLLKRNAVVHVQVLEGQERSLNNLLMKNLSLNLNNSLSQNQSL